MWVGASLDHETSVIARRRGEAAAAGGAAELTRGTEAALAELRAILPGQPTDRLVVAPGGSWPLTLPDFLVTRLVEFTVHVDDLSVSVGIPAPAQPPQVTDTVLVLLTPAGGAPARPHRGTARAQPCRARARHDRGVLTAAR